MPPKKDILNSDEQRELEVLEKTKNEGFIDEELPKNKKAGAPIAPLGGSNAYYFDYSDPHPPFEDVLPLEFQPAGRIYWYYYPENKSFSDDRRISEGDLVVAYSERGLEIAKVLHKSENDYKKQSKIDFIKYGIVRKATEEDLQKEQLLANRAKDAWRVCEDLNRALGITMKIRKVKITLDDSKVIVYFTAPGRVDFRELIKRLASTLHRRIEMRQIGVRDTTKMIGAIGPCGMELCCRRFLHAFMPVSVKMAKDQNLSLNPNKISGNCGRLFCCLSYENDLYEDLRKDFPREEMEVTERDSGRRGFVKKVNVLAGTVSVVFPSTESEAYEERLIPREQFARTEQNRWVVLPDAPLSPKTALPEKEDMPLPPFRPEKADRDKERQGGGSQRQQPSNEKQKEKQDIGKNQQPRQQRSSEERPSHPHRRDRDRRDRRRSDRRPPNRSSSDNESGADKDKDRESTNKKTGGEKPPTQ